MFPDLEVPVIILLFGNGIPNHLVLHSLLGAATIGTIFSMIITRWVYPPLISGLFRIGKSKVERNCRLSSTLLFSVLLGNLSHVLLDFATHLHNPILWPFTDATRSPFVAFLGLQNASLAIHVLMAVFFLLLILYKRRDLSRELFVE